MRTIDLQTWPRRKHFEFFNTYDHPHFSMCANLDLTAFYPAVKQGGHSLTIAIVYAITRASNAVPEFRYRIRGEKVIEHEIVNPGFTILVDEDLFSFCTADYSEDFLEFAANAAERIAYVKENPWVNNVPQDDLFYMSVIPWVSFTSFKHPMNLQAADSVPRFAWGKIFTEGELLKMPLDVQGHHALMDGAHIGKFYTELQNLLDQPEVMLGKG